MSTQDQLQSMHNDLAGVDGYVPWSLGAAFNAALAEIQSAQPDNAVVQALTPVEKSGSADLVSTTHAPAFRVMVGQLLAALYS